MLEGGVIFRIESVSDFVRQVSAFVKWAEKASVENKIIFRGQSNAVWNLVPSSQRQDKLVTKDINPAIKKETAEKVFKQEKSMLNDFKKRSRPHLANLPGTEWEWLALAQHYGLATRLLDWTEYAGAALFFAVQKPENLLEADIEESAVWCCIAPNEAPEDRLSPFDVENVYLYKPPHIAPRITVQRGCFTIHPWCYLTKRFDWLGDKASPKYIKIVIPRSFRRGIREDLKRIGIHRASLFPELNVISSEINKLHSTAGLDFILN